SGEREDAKQLAHDDPDCAAEVTQLEAEYEEATETLHRLLIPRDPDDARNVILEIKGGEGGEEAALFAADLARMYLRFADNLGWKPKLIRSPKSNVAANNAVRTVLPAMPMIRPKVSLPT